jgi:hypothetical protein
MASTRCSSNSAAAAVHHIDLQPAAEVTQPLRRTNSPEDFLAANSRRSRPPRSRHLKIRTTAICMAGTLTTTTPACRVVTQVRRTTQTRRGRIQCEAQWQAFTGDSAFHFWSHPTCPTSATCPPPMMWQQPPPPMNFTTIMAAVRPMMPTTPYQAINYMGKQF